MINISEMLNSYVGRVIISVIWGLGLAALFKRACTDRKCQVIQYKGPDPEMIQKTYFKYGTDNCYRYIPYLSPCEE